MLFLFFVLSLMTILSSNALRPYLKRTGRRRALSIRTPKGYELRVSTSSEDSFAPDPLPNSIGNFFLIIQPKH